MRRWRGFCLRRVATRETYDNRKVSEALERYLDGSADKDEAEWIDEILAESKLTLSDLRVRAFKDAARHIKMVDDLIHRQHQTIRHLQRSIDSIDYKSRLIKRMDLELAALESKQSVKGVLTLDDNHRRNLANRAMHLNQPAPDRRLGSGLAAKIPASMA